ncbi:hypothetical protein BaRGS_00038425 [Batillaria attramentaria]|uniref:HD domain-containing protein n=1 Tax=Batillaria attramentaria TaxID=370345 RepID=A0ABD0J7D4_9CAEN
MENDAERSGSGHLPTGRPKVGKESFVVFLLVKLGRRFIAGNTQVVNDPVHGHIELHPLCVAIMDTPEFQRLRDIRQLGGVSYVYPGGSHSRFEHSLGVCHLAGRLVRALRERQNDLNISDKDVLCVEIAGLCHDMGHGPFSHLYDKDFIPETQRLKGESGKWKHEQASCDMLDHMKEDLKKEFKKCKSGLSVEEDLEFIKGLIMGNKDQPGTKRGKDKSFLYEIVANDRNGVDVDKWDYFLRDCHHVGVRSSFYPDRFIHFARVIDVVEGGKNERQICWRDKEIFNVYEMFHTRYNLHRMVYQHETVKAVELMLVDVLALVDDVIKIPGERKGEPCSISGCRTKMGAYVNLSDGILNVIRLSTDGREDMKKAQKLLDRIDRRDLYPCISQCDPFKMEEEERQIWETRLGELEDKLKKKKIPRDKLVTMGVKKDPVKEVRFYSKESENKVLPKEWSSAVSLVAVPAAFQESLVRVYLTSTDGASFDLVETVFKEWCDEYKLKSKPGKRKRSAERRQDDRPSANQPADQ